MKTIRRPNQYLQLRGEVWYYARRVPSLIVKEIGRSMISRSLETDSVSIACKRRDMCAGADDARWHKLMPSTFGRPNLDRSLRQARKESSAMGFAYKPVEELSAPHNYEELAQALTLRGAPDPREGRYRARRARAYRHSEARQGDHHQSARHISNRDCLG